jgi:two-component system cell cycle sensor histidine kinase/response regulator CckA
MGALHVAIARAPGWRIARLFAAIAFTAAAYNVLSVIFCTGNLPDAAYLAAAKLTYLIVTVHAACWILYAYADKHGSLDAAPGYLTWLAVSAVILGATVTGTGWLFKPRVEIRYILPGNVTYHYPVITGWGDIYCGFIAALGAFAFTRLARRYRGGERTLKWQLVFYGVFLLCAIDEVLVAHGVVKFPSLLNAGFLLVVMPLTLHTVRRISNDARRLRELSGYLKGEVVRRTEERDEVRKALHETQEDLREVVSSLDEIVWEADAQGLNVTFVSVGASRLLGYPSSDDRQKAFWPRYVHPDDRERLVAEALDALKSNEVVRLEHRMLSADGRILWFRDSLHPVAGAHGAPARLRGVMTDITESRRAQESLIESEERFRKIADAAPVLIWARDEQGQVTYVNKQALAYHGRSLEQLRGKGWMDLVHADDRERVRSAVTESVASQRDYQMEFRQLRADGEFRWMLSTAVPRFAGSEYAGHIGTVVDITQLKHDQEQGLAAQKLESLGVLAGGVAHDFNNLLGSILADSELLLADLPEGSPAHEGINRINGVAIRAAEIVRELMTFAGQENPSFEPVDVSSLVREMLELLKVSISKRAVLSIELAEGLPPVLANASQLRQIVMNLITNASEALGQGSGVIAVSSDLVVIGPDVTERSDLTEGEYVRLKVSDTGCGMTREIQDKIFDPFFTTKFTGRGLGLAAVQGIVRSHRGAIQLTSAPGAGTRFEVLLPRSQGVPEPLPVPPPEPVGRVASLTGTVLMVDDEEMLRVAVSRMLRKKGFSVIEAGDGHTALDLFRAKAAEIGVILLDMTLPGLSGRKLFEELRRIRPDVRVILTTAYSKEMAANAVGSPQAWGFIRKPYHIADLITMLQSAQASNGLPSNV